MMKIEHKSRYAFTFKIFIWWVRLQALHFI